MKLTILLSCDNVWHCDRQVNPPEVNQMKCFFSEQAWYWSSALFGTTTNVFLVMSIEAWDQISAQICDLVPHVSDLTSLSNENRAMFLFIHLGYKNSGVVCGPSENILNDTRPSQQWRPIFICVLFFLQNLNLFFFVWGKSQTSETCFRAALIILCRWGMINQTSSIRMCGVVSAVRTAAADFHQISSSSVASQQSYSVGLMLIVFVVSS